MVSPKKIMFVCSWNSARSPMAEHMLNKLYSSKYAAESAGVEASDFADPFTVSVMRSEHDVDLINFEPRALHDVDDIDSFDTLIALSEQAYATIKKDKAKNNRAYGIEFWDTPPPPDRNQPRDMIVDGYKALLATISGHIENRFGYD